MIFPEIVEGGDLSCLSCDGPNRVSPSDSNAAFRIKKGFSPIGRRMSYLWLQQLTMKFGDSDAADILRLIHQMLKYYDCFAK